MMYIIAFPLSEEEGQIREEESQNEYYGVWLESVVSA